MDMRAHMGWLRGFALFAASADRTPGITHIGAWSDASATVARLRRAGAKLDDARFSVANEESREGVSKW
jgi:hypothetical protein